MYDNIEFEKRDVLVSKCKWPIPDRSNKNDEHIINCLNYGYGCWQCTTEDNNCWCYMVRMWNMRSVEIGQVFVKDNVTALIDQIKNGYSLESNLGMCSSHDPFHELYLSVTVHILQVLSDYCIDGKLWKDTDPYDFWNGHTLHIVTKRPSRIGMVLSDMPMIPTAPSDDDWDIEWPRVWSSICTPDEDQSRRYMRDVDSPRMISFAMNQLDETGFDDLGASFGPCFGGWRDEELRNSYLRSLPPFNMAQFETMNHGNQGLDVLDPDEVKDLAHDFKSIQPGCRIYLKDTPFKVGRVI
ncbi:MAG: hypothetical protein GF411_00010 [Candidatus Lokiarchaeota archaeon]|nr:hypothetical protein [Candidatus Lokiarchaeota archaeon]